MSSIDRMRGAFRFWLLSHPDETILRWLYRAVLAATVVVVALDYGELTQQSAANAVPAVGEPDSTRAPVIRHQRGTRYEVPSQEMEAKLNGKMTFDLVDDGRLVAIGTITPGTAKVFAAEVEKRGAYIKTVVLQSPGGSVNDALAMGRLIRARKFATEVGKGHYCASSCPLVFAGGVTRHVGAKAAIGVHQVFAPPQPGLATPADGMESAQRIAATAESYLRDMGVDLGVWVHAMQTPKNEIYYFSPAELQELKLVTESPDGANAKARGRRKS
jgi:hypothetical protein